jgi:hypothetical protein
MYNATQNKRWFSLFEQNKAHICGYADDNHNPEKEVCLIRMST